jgi:transposase-like protein
MAVSVTGAHFPREIILTCVRWYVAYPLSTRHVEELMRERGVPVDHSTAASARSGSAGGWMKRRSKSKASDITCIVRWIKSVRPSISS